MLTYNQARNRRFGTMIIGGLLLLGMFLSWSRMDKNNASSVEGAMKSHRDITNSVLANEEYAVRYSLGLE
jgi:hypothetical protein